VAGPKDSAKLERFQQLLREQELASVVVRAPDASAGSCVAQPCVVASDCVDGGLCDTSHAIFQCVQCISTADCSGNLVCDPTTRTCVVPPPPVDGPDVSIRAALAAQADQAKADGARELLDRNGGRWQLGNQGRVELLLSAHCMNKIETLYGTVFQDILGEQISTKPVEIVDIFDSENRTVTVYCSASTFLPLRQRFYHRDPITKERREELSHFTKYKDVGGGVMWPLDLQRKFQPPLPALSAEAQPARAQG